jgi:hypothetical protein
MKIETSHTVNVKGLLLSTRETKSKQNLSLSIEAMLKFLNKSSVICTSFLS